MQAALGEICEGVLTSRFTTAPHYYSLLLRPVRWRCTRRSGGFESVGPDTWETERKKLTHPQEKGDKKAWRGGEELMG